ncbi:MAG: sigma-70 family RNA polymerase sigma factor, partial [Planctomycetota bacterium]
LLTLPNWLARVARNRALDVRRERTRRTQRELAAAAPDMQEPVDATCERLAVQRDVVAAVLGLHEPYRSVVVHRYFHGLEPTEIAARLRSKPATVRTQLTRAHELLQQRLDQHRPRDAWASALLPLLGHEPIAVSTSSLLLVGASLLLATTGTWMWWPGSLAAPAPSESPPTGSRLAAAAFAAPGADAADSPTRHVAAPLVQAPPSRPFPEILTARALLRDLTRYGNYEDSAFSFELAYGGRDRKGKDKARGDYEVGLSNDSLRVNLVTDDTSLLVDLGEVPLLDLVRIDLEAPAKLVQTAAEAFFGKREAQRGNYLSAVHGHTYFVWTQDTNSDGVAVFEIVERSPGEQCVLEWYWTEDGSYARGSLPSPKGKRTLAEAALQLRQCATAAWEQVTQPLRMQSPEVVFRARCGAIGGNPCKLYLSREHNGYLREIRSEPFDVTTSVGIHDERIGYCSGGLIPLDRKFVVTSVTWVGEARGDSNGGGLFHVQLDNLELVRVTERNDAIRGSWSGRVELVSGQEQRLFFAISNSSQGEVIVRGTFEPLTR